MKKFSRSKFFQTSHELTPHAQKLVGLLILGCAIVAMISANVWDGYLNFWDATAGIGDHLTRREFVDEFVMSIFFFAAGLELRHEFFHGHLREKKQRRLPVLCAFAGIALPLFLMLCFALATHAFPGTDSKPLFLSLPVPVATDTVFAIALLSFFSKRIPRELRSLLLAIVVIDDVAGLGVLTIIKGDIPPTVIAVIIGFILPTKIGSFRLRKALLSRLVLVVNLMVLPLFAFANGGITVDGLSFGSLMSAPLFWALIISQCVGKIVGVYGMTYIATKKKWADLPHKCKLNHMFVAACSAGIGFTLSLYLAKAALEDYPQLHAIAKIAILTATTISAVVAIIAAAKIPRKDFPAVQALNEKQIALSAKV